MAVDTPDRRFAMMGLARTGMGLYVMPIPDGVIDTDDRAHYLYLYPGIALSGVVPFDNAGGWFVLDRRRDRLPKVRGC